MSGEKGTPFEGMFLENNKLLGNAVVKELEKKDSLFFT